MLRGQRSQVRKRGGERAQWGQPEESPQAKTWLTPASGEGSQGAGWEDWGRV